MGEPWDFEVEALRHVDSVYRVALWLCGDPTEASDLTQDTYERAFRARATFTRTNMRAWLFTILRHRFLNVRRHREVAGEVPLEEPELVGVPSIPDLPAGLVRRDIEAALLKLPPELRLPLLLADVEELSMAEIAETLYASLFVLPLDRLREAASFGAAPVLTGRQAYRVAYWTHGGLAYVLVSEAPEGEIHRLATSFLRS